MVRKLSLNQHVYLHNKGQIELPFQLIFALVAGSIILLIFVIFAFKGWDISQQKSSIFIADTLTLLLTSTEVSPKTFLPIDDLPKSKIEFGCEGFSVNGQQKSYRNKIVFGPSSVTTTRLRLWSFDWNVPFYVTNMIAVTSPGILYVFVGDPTDSLIKTMQDTIPKNMSTLLFCPSTFCPRASALQPTGHEQTRFIFVNTNPSLPPAFSGKKISGLSVNTASNILTFLQPRTLGQTKDPPLPIIGMPMLYGAIFADNIETYKCNLDKAYQRLGYLAQIYDEKQKFLQDNSPRDRSCTYSAPLEQLKKNPSSLNANIIESIKKSNHLLQQQSCPLIY